MRSIFIALVVINILVFSLQWFNRSHEPAKPLVGSAAERVSGDGDSLKFLDEVEPHELATSSRRNHVRDLVNVPAESTNESQSSTACIMVGPYIQLLHAEYLVERLEAMDVPAEIKLVEVPDGLGYWVYLPPEMSEKEALRRLYEIQTKNIDSYIIPSGELANGISFGMFNEQGLAQARLDEIRLLGYQAQLREVSRTHNETWVLLMPDEAEKIDPALWVDLLNQQRGLEKRQNLCLGVASE